MIPYRDHFNSKQFRGLDLHSTVSWVARWQLWVAEVLSHLAETGDQGSPLPRASAAANPSFHKKIR